ncbi:MAG: Zn-ribbon domain-containing OB-fold protein [Candidatus Micrarchaeia archaeon]
MKPGLATSWRRMKERYLLTGSHCDTCNLDFFPVRKICPLCRRKGKMSEKKFKGTGTVFSYTTVFSPPAGFDLRTPYVLALIKLDDGPNILGMIDDAKPEEVYVGARVEKIYRKWIDESDGGLIHYGFAFRLIR